MFVTRRAGLGPGEPHGRSARVSGGRVRGHFSRSPHRPHPFQHDHHQHDRKARAIREVVANFPGVSDVHDMHVWTLGAGHDALTVHVVRSENSDPDLGPLLSKKLRESFTIEYVTVQVEATKEPCGAPPSPSS